jgi:hypothetical protein
MRTKLWAALLALALPALQWRQYPDNTHGPHRYANPDSVVLGHVLRFDDLQRWHSGPRSQ